MLRYFANGIIRLNEPIRCNTRTNWEFQAVLKGRSAPMFRDGEKSALRERTLWVFAPECSHAWIDDRPRKFHRLSLHFGSVPHQLEELVRRNGGWLERSLHGPEVGQLKAIAAELKPHYLRPNLLSPLLFEARLLDLTLLLLAGHGAEQPPALPDLANFKVENALAWYARHLACGPSVKEVADAVHISTSHLRRLFWQVRHTSPKASFQRIRLDQAQELMSRTALTLEDVAKNCGYASSSHFCREYRSLHGFTPTHWRKKLVVRFKNPLPPGVTATRPFSIRPHERSMPA